MTPNDTGNEAPAYARARPTPARRRREKRQREAARLLWEGAKVGEVAARLRVDRRTLTRWQAGPVMRREREALAAAMRVASDAELRARIDAQAQERAVRQEAEDRAWRADFERRYGRSAG